MLAQQVAHPDAGQSDQTHKAALDRATSQLNAAVRAAAFAGLSVEVQEVRLHAVGCARTAPQFAARVVRETEI
jgi:hypothetical protein